MGSEPANNSFKTHLLALLRSLGKWFLYATRALSRYILNAFTQHPAQTRETYLQHLWFTIKTSLRFVALGVLLFLHGVFPFIFVRTASIQVERIYLLMRSRIPQPRRETIESQYDI
jgi:hypothetical protein